MFKLRWNGWTGKNRMCGENDRMCDIVKNITHLGREKQWKWRKQRKWLKQQKKRPKICDNSDLWPPLNYLRPCHSKTGPP